MKAKRLIIIVLSMTFALCAHSISFAQENTPISSPKCNKFTFDATGSYDPDNKDLTFFWNFGDGNTSQDAITQHAYTRSGDYDVTLTITDNAGLECSSATTTQTVRSTFPPQAIIKGKNAVCINEPVSLDASSSYAENRAKLYYDWNFGDGTVKTGSKRITKTYSEGGDYKVILTVDDNSGTLCGKTSEEKIIHVNAPPEADAGDDILPICVNSDSDLIIQFDASNTSDVNNDRLNYKWDFGDGKRAVGAKVSHRYDSVGNYDVRLVVKDDSQLECNTAVDFINVRLNKAPIADAGEDIIACAGDEIDFDGSYSYIYKKGTVEAKWFFGDGQTSNGLKTKHIYNKPGKYQASLELENKLNENCAVSRDTRNVTINSIPTVNLNAKHSICLGDEIQFDASSGNDDDGDSLEYYWTFGDGTILRAGPKVTHKYRQGGTYRATVIVDDGKGSACSTATAVAQVKVNTPPVADAGPNLTCCVGRDTVFDASSSTDPDGDQLTYTWEFGDGTKLIGKRVNHAYSKSGSYNVTLTVDDNAQTSCSKSKTGFTASVNTSPVPVINIR